MVSVGFWLQLAAATLEGGLVGSHHMVTLPWAGGATEYQGLFDEEARRWKDAGQDFVILHMDAYDGHYPAQLRAYYDACAKVGIKASASWAWFDRSAASGDQGGTWIPQIVRDTKDHPAQWKIDGVPVYSAFNLPSYTQSVLQSAGLWPVKIWAHSYYYALTGGQLHWTSDANVIRKTYDTLPWIDGLANFAGDMPAEKVTSLNQLLTTVGRERGKKTMAGVIPFYGSHQLWEIHYSGLEQQWRGILQNQPEAVWWVTSNDWRELSYVSELPEAPVWDNHWNIGDLPPILDHSGYRKFAEPFLAAYKAGSSTPSFPSDRLFLTYQLHPKNAEPVAGSGEDMFGGRDWRASLADRIFLAAHLTAPARLSINGVLSEEFPAGTAHFSIPLAVGNAPQVAIVRNGASVKTGAGPLPITNSVLIGAWNYLAVEVELQDANTAPTSYESYIWPKASDFREVSAYYYTFTRDNIGGAVTWSPGSFGPALVKNITNNNQAAVVTLSDAFAVGTSLLLNASLDGWGTSITFRDHTGQTIKQFIARGGENDDHRDSNGESWLYLQRAATGWSFSWATDGHHRYNDAIFTIGGGRPLNSGQYHKPAAYSDWIRGGFPVRFHTTARRFYLYLWLNDTQFRIVSKGVVTHETSTDSSRPQGTWAVFPIEFEHAGGKDIEVLFDRDTPFVGIMVPPAEGQIQPWQGTAWTKSMAVIGDSITEGGTRGYAWTAARLLNLNAVARPMGSTGYIDPGFLNGYPHDFHTRLEADVFQHEPDIVLVSGGINDQSHPLDNQNDPAAFATAVQSLFDRVNARLPNATKVALSPYWPNQNFPAVNQQYTNIVRDAAAARGWHFIDFRYIANADVSRYISGDGVHPSREGWAYLGVRLAQDLQPIVGGTITVPPSTGTGSSGSSGGSSGTSGGGTTTTGSLTSSDIGSPALAGSTALSNGVFTIQAGGADIWGGSDQFRFARQSVSGNTELIVRVDSLTQTDAWAKAGLMLRASANADSAHVSLLVTPGNGVRLQWRDTSGGQSSSSGGNGETAPRWLRLTRSGSTITGFSSTNPDSSGWTQIASVNVSLPDAVLAGLAVTAHNSGALTTAVFSNFTIAGASPGTSDSGSTGGGTTTTPPAGGTTTVASLTTGDVGSPALAGSTTYDSSTGTFTLRGAGADIWGGADQFHYGYQSITGNTELVVRVASLTQTDAWAKAGLMLRASTAAGSAHVSLFVTPSNGVRMQWRGSTSGESSSSGGNGEAAPRWLKLTRSGSTFTAFSSPNGSSWTQIASTSISLPDTVLGGLAATAHNTGALTTAVFTNFTISGTTSTPPDNSSNTGGGTTPPSTGDTTTPPSGGTTTVASLTTGDIGSPALAGSTTYDSATSTFTLRGAGADIWGTSDQFHFAYQAITGNTELVVRVGSLTQTDAWAKAGLMLRASTAAGSPHVAVYITPGNGVSMQWRGAASAETQHHSVGGQSPPRWLKLTRSGSTFTAFSSADGNSWSQINSTNVSLPDTVLGGLALTSHNTGALTTAVFTNFTISGVTSTPPDNSSNTGGDTTPPSTGDTTTPPSGGTTTVASLTSGDIGSPALAGSTAYDSATSTFTLRGAGADIWSGSDQLHFAFQSISGNTELVVRVASLTQTDAWAKAGLMLRASTAAGSAHVSLLVTPSNGVRLQWRDGTGLQTGNSSGNGETAPRWLKLIRSGNTFTGFSSADGNFWTQIHSVSVALPDTVLGGLALTSHNTSTLATAVFTNFSVSGAPAGGSSSSSSSGGGTTSTPPTSSTSPLVQLDIGSPGRAGSSLFDPNTGVYYIKGGGADIWGASDQFQFAYQQLAGDCTLVARVTSLTATDIWAKAGLMLRTSANADSAHVSLFVTPGNGVRLQWREATGGQSASSNGNGETAPRWLKLTRSGSTITGYSSTNGSSWTQIASVTVSLPDTVLAGLAVTAHNNGLLTDAVLDNVAITQP